MRAISAGSLRRRRLANAWVASTESVDGASATGRAWPSMAMRPPPSSSCFNAEYACRGVTVYPGYVTTSRLSMAGPASSSPSAQKIRPCPSRSSSTWVPAEIGYSGPHPISDSRPQSQRTVPWSEASRRSAPSEAAAAAAWRQRSAKGSTGANSENPGDLLR